MSGLRIVLGLLAVCALVFSGCGDEEPDGTGTSGTSGTSGTTGDNPPVGQSGFLNAEPDLFSTVAALKSDAGPWLTWRDPDGATDHIVVSWGRTTAHRAVFLLGTTPGTLTELVVTNSLSRNMHSFLCSGLQPATTYYYRIDNDGGTNLLPERSFRTAPDVGTDFQFIFTSDTRPKYTNPLEDSEAVATGAALAADPQAAGAAFALNVGDIVDRGRAQDWKSWLTKYWGGVLAKFPVIPVVGNHDFDEWNTSIGKNNSYYKDLFVLPGEEWFFRQDYGRTRFIALDTGWTTLPKAMDLSFRAGQLAFLNAELAKAKTDKEAGTLDFLFILIHKGIGNCGNHGTDDDITALRAQISPILAAGPVDFVLQSHEHSWQRNTWNGAFYLVSGTGGSYSDGDNGERLMDRAPAGLVNHYFTKEKGYTLVDVAGKNVTFTHRTKAYVNLDTTTYRLVTITYQNPRGWSSVRLRYANAFDGDIPVWSGAAGREMTAVGGGAFRITIPVMQHGSGEYRTRLRFHNGAGEIDDKYGDDWATTGDDPVIAGTVVPPLAVTIVNPVNDANFVNIRAITVSGTAVPDTGDSISSVALSLNDGAWQPAAGTGNWSIGVNLAPGITNTLRAKAISVNGQTNTSAVIRVGHTILPAFIIDGAKEAAWNNAALWADASDDPVSVPIGSPDMNLTTLYLTNDGYYLYAGWDLGTNAMQANTMWYLAIDTGAAGGATNMAGFGQGTLSAWTTWDGAIKPDLMAYFKYNNSANGGLNGFWVSTAAGGTAIHLWDTTGAVVSHTTRWAEARIPLAGLGLVNDQLIRCWLAVSKHDNANRAFLDHVPRLGAEWPFGGSWSAGSRQELTSAWAEYTLRGVENE